MADWLTELRFSGRPNPTLELIAAQAQSLWLAIGDLKATEKKKDACWHCSTLAQMDYMLTREEGDDYDAVFITGEYIISRRGTLHDSEGRVRSVLTSVITAITSAGAVWLVKSKALAGDQRRCTHAEGKHKSTFGRCGCGSPGDAAVWQPMNICEASNCYNFAVKDVWCKIEKGKAVGATPNSVPADMTNYNDWADILAHDGIVKAAGPTTTPTGHSGGWNIALAVKGFDFHFIRRDGGIWTHKFGQRPPQICDGAGQGMADTELASAELCGYQLVGYFYVPAPLKINH